MPDSSHLIDEILTSATVSAVGEPTTPVTPFEQKFLNFKISGLDNSTIQIQASVDSGLTFQVSESFASADLDDGDVTKAIFHGAPDIQYRFEVTTYAGGDQISVVLVN